MNPLLIDKKIEKVLHLKRTLSVKNLVMMLDVSIEQVQDILIEFREKQYLRITHAKTCSSRCSSCNTCPAKPQQNITESDIIISLLFSRTEDYAD